MSESGKFDLPAEKPAGDVLEAVRAELQQQEIEFLAKSAGLAMWDPTLI